jgi:parallel beta-helix repeat protein
VLVALALWGAGAPAHAETTGCTTVSSLPATLVAPGHYCLQSDLSVSGAAANGIVITAVNVVLDCNDHRVSAATADNTGAGIMMSDVVSGTVIRNCRVDGFYYGIYSAYSESAEPRKLTISGNRITRSNLAGMFLFGSANLIEGNVISDGRRITNGYPTGIYLLGGASDLYASGNVIRGNVIQDFRPPTPTDGSYNLSIGIQVNYQAGVIIEDNTIVGLRARTGGGTYGIVSSNSREVLVRGNRVLSPPPAAAPYDGGNWSGIFLQGTAEELASNHCAENLVGHFNGNYNGCSSTGNTGF